MPPYGALGAGLGAGAGVGLGGLLGQIGGVMDAPRKFVWQDLLGLPEHGADVLSQHLGMDPESGLTQGLGMGLEMLGDPMTWAGGALMGKAGRMFGGAAESLAGRSATGASLRAELPMVERATQAAAGGVTRNQGPLSEALKGATYHPDVLAEMPNFPKAGFPKTYGRADPAVAQLVNDMGIGSAMPGGGVQVMQKPSFAKGRGGKMFGEAITEGGLPGGSMSSLQVPGMQAGSMDMQEIIQELSRQPVLEGKQLLNTAMPANEVLNMRTQFPGLGNQDVERKLVQGVFSSDPRTMKPGPFTHVTDMEMSKALPLLQARKAEIAQQLSGLADPSTMSILERLLAKRFGAM